MFAVPQMPNIAECDKLTWEELKNAVYKFNRENNVRYASPSEQPKMICRVVFNPFNSGWKKFQSVWDKNGNVIEDTSKPITYTPASCTYEFDNFGKYWDSSLCGTSIFARSLDPNESDYHGIKLTDYIGKWCIDYCYIVEVNGVRKYQ